MAAMVARGSSPLASLISIQEKSSRNKRKFRADQPLADPDSIASQVDCSYGLFPMDKNLETGDCELCRTHAYSPLREGVEQERFQEADWIGNTESQLEETVLGTLDMIYKSAIRTITCYGYTKEIATNAVLGAGHCYGCKDAISNVVDNALAYLRSGQQVDSYPREDVPKDLNALERSALSEMVNVIRDFRPFYSRGDALWRLLICDLNVTLACAMDSNDSGSVGSEETSAQAEQESNSSTYGFIPVFESNAPGSGSSNPNTLLPYPHKTSETEMATEVGIPSLPCGRFSASVNVDSQVSSLGSSLGAIKENAVASLAYVVEETSSLYVSQPSLPEGKPSGGKKGHFGSPKRDSIMPHQKTFHLEKSYRMFRPKAAIRAGKSSLGGLVLDKKYKAIPDNMKNSVIKLNKHGSDALQADATLNVSFREATSNNASATLPVANTELSLSLPCLSSSNNAGCTGATEAGFPSGNLIPQEKMDEMLQKLILRVKELEAQLQEWSDWAQQKVMQAARRLAKDKPELQRLQQEKEEVARLKKEKQSLEEDTRKKLAEMEVALSKASAQVEKSSKEAREREEQNSELRKEMEAAKLRAAESAASCQEVSRRETETLKQFQSWDREKAQLQEELTTEKKKLAQLQQQLEQAKERHRQIEALWKHEEKAKEEALALRNARRKEREQAEVLGRLKENEMKMKAETDLQRYKDDIRKLAQQIVRLRQRTDSSKIASLKWGPDSSYGRKESDSLFVSGPLDFLETKEVRKENDSFFVSGPLDFLETEEVQRERECVMCLADEVSVVFLPCAHQVLCAKCNELHERQGMKDCPSCRAVIERRICVRSSALS